MGRVEGKKGENREEKSGATPRGGEGDPASITGSNACDGSLTSPPKMSHRGGRKKGKVRARKEEGTTRSWFECPNVGQTPPFRHLKFQKGLNTTEKANQTTKKRERG